MNNNQYFERASYSWSEDSIRLYGSPGDIAKAIYFYMQEVGYFKTKYPYFTERAHLNSFLIVYTLSGEGILTYEGKEYTLTHGSCFWINCMNYHEYHTVKGKNWEFLWLHFNGINALGYYEKFIHDGFRLVHLKAPSASEKCLRRIVEINQSRDITTETLTSQYIVDMLTELLLTNITGSREMTQLPEYIQRTQKYMEQHFTEKISLDELAQLLHVSKYHLVREFGRYVGITPYQYLIDLRIAWAKEMLKYSQQTVEEISYICGMDHVSQFITLFKKREHKTPLQYRKEWK